MAIERRVPVHGPVVHIHFFERLDDPVRDPALAVAVDAVHDEFRERQLAAFALPEQRAQFARTQRRAAAHAPASRYVAAPAEIGSGVPVSGGGWCVVFGTAELVVTGGTVVVVGVAAVKPGSGRRRGTVAGATDDGSGVDWPTTTSTPTSIHTTLTTTAIAIAPTAAPAGTAAFAAAGGGVRADADRRSSGSGADGGRGACEDAGRDRAAELCGDDLRDAAACVRRDRFLDAARRASAAALICFCCRVAVWVFGVLVFWCDNFISSGVSLSLLSLCLLSESELVPVLLPPTTSPSLPLSLMVRI